MLKRGEQSIYDIGDRIVRNPCSRCKKVPSIVKKNGLWYVECTNCERRSPHSKYLYKTVFQWNMSRYSITPHFSELKLFRDCFTLSQAERVLGREIREREKEWKEFMSNPINKRKRGIKRTHLNLIKEQLQYYKWVLNYWKRKRNNLSLDKAN